MTSPDRRRLSFREAAEVLNRRHGPLTYRSLGLVRLINILWYMVVGKRRFVPDDARVQAMRAEKKRTRQQRRRNRRHHG
jgi:hypothetical protein